MNCLKCNTKKNLKRYSILPTWRFGRGDINRDLVILCLDCKYRIDNIYKKAENGKLLLIKQYYDLFYTS